MKILDAVSGGVGALALAALAMTPSEAHASDACSPMAIVTSADVRVSDGVRYTLETFFNAIDVAATRQTRPNGEINVMAIEGPTAWTSGATELGGDMERTLTLGHQFHALLLHFDDLVRNPRDANVTFRNEARRARVGDWAYGDGEAQLVFNAAGTRPEALIFSFPGAAPIEMVFSNWRRAGGVQLPHRLAIDDGRRQFDYRFTRIALEAHSANWLFDTLAAPDIDAVQIHRLHRRALAAHCEGDAAALAALTAPDSIDISRGAINAVTPAGMQTRFASVFEQLDYTGYSDSAWPIIEVADSGDVAWLAARVQAMGVERTSGSAFDNHWSWVMVLRKVDGAWRSSGIAATAE
jgi:ketosteroid isomerase-like protein